MTGGTFILPPPSSSDEDDSDRDWSATADEEDVNDLSMSEEEQQTIHVGPSSYSSRDEIAMTELGEAPLPLHGSSTEEHGTGTGMWRRKRGGAGGRERRVEWVGKPHVVGPEWMKMPLLTIGMLGLQCVWSIEMGYASPYLLDLGLSKSLMSLVFVAGPLSGLIMQPIIGVLADRSRSRFGRRRPFMLAGCVVSVFAMMLLSWAREVAGWCGGGTGLAIGLAVWAIYLIDFSINAVQATDRALVVDILPPSQQEQGNAWAGRMFGTGSLAGFYVGNINLLAIFPILGKTQLQVLSFLTSIALMVTHGLTAYSVKERVLLRDNRKSSQLDMKSTIHSIWKNIFTLPPAIRSICYAQFFAWIGWFPILFYTSVWVGEIYTREAINRGGRSPDDPLLPGEAVRAGSRALFMNSIVNLLTSVFLPFFVSSSGIGTEVMKPVSTGGARYRSAEETGGVVNGFASLGPSGSSAANGEGLTVRASRLMQKLDKIRAVIKVPSRLRMQLPIQGFTLIRAWILGQAVFAGTMFATWFAGSVWSAQAIICVNGFCWGVAQWAPFSLLGELILLDANVPESHDKTLPVIRMIDEEGDDAFPRQQRPNSRSAQRMYALDAGTEEEEALMTSTDEMDIDHPDHKPHHHEFPAGRPGHSRTTSTSVDLTPRFSESRNRTPLGSRRGSRELAEHALSLGKQGKSASSSKSRLSHELTAARSSFDVELHPAHDRLEVGGNLRVSRSDDGLYGSGGGEVPFPNNGFSARDERLDGSYPPRQGDGVPKPKPRTARKKSKGQGTAEKAGVILGIHNIFIVIPQFLVTFLSAIIFYIMEPTRPTLPEHHPTPNIPLSGNITLGTMTDSTSLGSADDSRVIKAARLLGRAVVEALRIRDTSKGRELEPHVTSETDSVGFIFRLGGISAAIAGFMLYRMSKRFGPDPL
ncbi:hypothetical protein QFC21_004016 [Naganishia friedmannii]|uniref:Uncharacterized protein n=1 Tax=Naganishia friedmannii TaxID=89922 RepID=A0ACC2VKR3_9TREE|nr:hypothetical protein QFC21_004016 [Naganishia friedmannii]